MFSLSCMPCVSAKLASLESDWDNSSSFRADSVYERAFASASSVLWDDEEVDDDRLNAPERSYVPSDVDAPMPLECSSRTPLVDELELSVDLLESVAYRKLSV